MMKCSKLLKIGFLKQMVESRIGIETKQFKNLSIKSDKFLPDWKDQWIRNQCMFLENNIYTDITDCIHQSLLQKKHVQVKFDF